MREHLTIPDHWLIDTYTPTWPYAEGVYVNDDVKPFILLGCVYKALMDIPEAKVEINECNRRIAPEFNNQLTKYYKPIITAAEAGNKYLTGPAFSETSQEQIIESYRGWVKKWALSSEQMLEWVVVYNMGDVVINQWLGGLSRRELRQGAHRLSSIGKNAFKDIDLAKSWRILWSAPL